MQRAEIRVIDQQSSQETHVEPNQYEVDALLAKYGYKVSPSTNAVHPQQQVHDNRTFEDMIRQQENQAQRMQQQQNRPRAVTFDDQNTHFAETRWSSIESENGLQVGMQITIVTDMKI